MQRSKKKEQENITISARTARVGFALPRLPGQMRAGRRFPLEDGMSLAQVSGLMHGKQLIWCASAGPIPSGIRNGGGDVLVGAEKGRKLSSPMSRRMTFTCEAMSHLSEVPEWRKYCWDT
jgi:hypothetical protein